MSAILESLGGVIIAPMQAKDGEWVSSGYLEDEKYSECLPEKASTIPYGTLTVDMVRGPLPLGQIHGFLKRSSLQIESRKRF